MHAYAAARKDKFIYLFQKFFLKKFKLEAYILELCRISLRNSYQEKENKNKEDTWMLLEGYLGLELEYQMKNENLKTFEVGKGQNVHTFPMILPLRLYIR